MPKRLTVIATRAGDDGTTGLGDGSRVAKDNARIAALGDVDELNSVLGVVLAEPGLDANIVEDLRDVQHTLFDMGAELSIPGYTRLDRNHVSYLDGRLAHYNGTLPALNEFILPGGSRPAGLLHVARTVCRRAERAVIALQRQEPVNKPVLQYLNRLSDLLFVMARVANRSLGMGDVYWRNPNKAEWK
ncbi:ATP:cob(I)alamin adenosyltransferase [Bordetella genomosp. 8]|uniref:Cobalamin adenosyltransferase n=1 Tax=Bordetella genomosp. 8 TaxID=1416806 RepID=A0A1W6YSH3_9BORD|nr:cob(I)yrinic acid a,c-diamide adenosyltransferase [Bordetella genomosp. 8]ARP84060.1 ATP:cob(I)alamin adenosyltransferase [Bordetella genomosp. 8]